jgi:hypothetical protein
MKLDYSKIPRIRPLDKAYELLHNTFQVNIPFYLRVDSSDLEKIFKELDRKNLDLVGIRFNGMPRRCTPSNMLVWKL